MSLSTGATAHSLAYFGEGSGLIHLNSVECSGLEYSLTDCMVQTNDVSSGEHSLDVGVKCQPGIFIATVVKAPAVNIPFLHS